VFSLNRTADESILPQSSASRDDRQDERQCGSGPAICPHETRRCLEARSGIMFGVPDLVSPVVPAGRLRDQVQPRLIVDELVLRPWEPADAARVVEAYGDPAIQKWHARSMTEPEALSWVMSWSERWTAETGACWAVTDEELLVGRVGLRTVDLTEGAGEAAYWVMPDARGRGVATRALRAATAWMFTHVGLHRIELLHSTGNQASCRVANQSGYGYEGTKRRQALHADGWHDMHLHARLRDDNAAARGGRPSPSTR
jgi:[ribosomal protein S5]-alanine N-acetyltransferase